MKLEILGMGCAKCNDLMEIAMEAVSELGIQADIKKVDNIKDIMAYGVMKTPALVIDGAVRVSGRVPSKEEIKVLIKG
jgi:small redox-active disulfide protein 2